MIDPDHQGYHEWIRLHGVEIVVVNGIPQIKLNIPCSWLENGRCKNYDKRPEMCRRWTCEE